MRRLLWFGLILTLALPRAFARQTPPQPLNAGQAVTGELNDVQQALQYLFDGRAGENITLLMQTTSGNLNAFLVLATFEGDPVATDDDSGGGTDARISLSLPSDGTYVVTATRSREATVRGAGTFSLTLTVGPASPNISPTPPLSPQTRLQPILRGASVQGTLSPPANFNLYWFQGQAGERISVTNDIGTRLQPLVVLYDNGFNEVGRNSPSAPLNASLPRQGLYLLAVGLPAGDTTGGTYSLTLSSGGNAAPLIAPPRDVEGAQTLISYGESVRGTLSDAQSAYTFQFEGRAGDNVEINMVRAGGDLDSYLFLLDAGGVSLLEDDNSGNSNGDARLRLTLPQDGAYFILATRKDETEGATQGNFLLTLQSDSAPPPVSTPPPSQDKPENLAPLPEIALNSALTGQIDDTTFISPYVFRAQAGETLVAALETLEGDLDPYLLLLDAAQVPLTENDDQSETNKNARLVFTVPASGYYILVATRFELENGQTAGTYRLSLAREGQEDRITGAGPSIATNTSGASLLSALQAVPIAPATTPSAAFAEGQLADIYLFTATEAGGLVDISAISDSGQVLSIFLLDERLTPLTVNDGGMLLGFNLPSAGTYAFLVAAAGGPAAIRAEGYLVAFNATGGGFVLPTPVPTEAAARATAESVGADDEILTITYGDTLRGQITDADSEERYRFTGAEGDIIRARMSAVDGSGLDTLLQLLGPNGNVLAENDDIVAGQDRNSTLQFTLPRDGEYILRATRFAGDAVTPPTIGAYTLTLEQVDPALAGVNPNPLPLASGQTVTNTINETQFLIFYRFEAQSGDRATLAVETLSGDLDPVMYVYTYTSAGQPVEIARNDDSPRGGTFDPLIENLVLPRTGVYLVAVGRFPDTTSRGDFALTLTLVNAEQAPSLPPPQTPEGTPVG